MKKFNKFIIQKDKLIFDAINLISINKNRAVFVLDKTKIIGVVSEGDIIKALSQNKKINTPLINIMNKSFKFVTKNDRNLALKYFKNDPISILPVVNKNMKIIDVITLKKILNRIEH